MNENKTLLDKVGMVDYNIMFILKLMNNNINIIIIIIIINNSIINFKRNLNVDIFFIQMNKHLKKIIVLNNWGASI